MPLSWTILYPQNFHTEALTPNETGDGALKEAGRLGEVARWALLVSLLSTRTTLRNRASAGQGTAVTRQQPPGLGENKSYC